VPYKGGAPAMTDLLGGHVPMMLQDLYQAAGPHKAGQLRVLAVLADQRSALLPDVPTAAEQGLPGLAIDTQFMLAAPAKTPSAVLGVLSQAVTKVQATPDFGVWARERGFELIQGSTPESTAQFIRKESAKWSEVIKAVDLKL
jgi:tripartite-type tricarboxylate transporter receptor subunit TctC